MTIASMVSKIISTASGIVPVLFSLAFLFFIFGLARYLIVGQGNEESREKGKKVMIYGLAGLVVMFLLWGIINLLLGLLTQIGGVSATSSV